MTVSGELKKKLECLEQDVPIICPPVNVQFSCHVCFQVSDTSYLIAMSDEYFDVQKSKAISFGQNAFLFLTSSLTRILSQILFFVRKNALLKAPFHQKQL